MADRRGDVITAPNRSDASLTTAQAAAERGELKRDQLRRMRWIATSLLGAMLLLLVISVVFGERLPALHWLRAFSEAAAVGAIADWFAVVALFRHPFGIPIPHTAIVVRNKDRIGLSLGDFVEHNFLTPENVMRRLHQYNLARSLANWVCVPINAERVARRISRVLVIALMMLGDSDVKRFFHRTVLPQLGRIDLARASGHILGILVADNRHRQLLDPVLTSLQQWLTEQRPMVQRMVGEQSRLTPRFVDRYIADKFVDGVINMMQEVAADPSHEIRLRFDAALHRLVEQLKTSPEMQQRAEALKRDLLTHLLGDAYYRQVWEELKALVLKDVAQPDSAIQATLIGALMRLGGGVAGDEKLQEKLNAWLTRTVESVLLTHRHEVSRLITDVVRSWDAREVSQKLELEIGKDLQFIRINGTLVGGLAGVVLHAATLALG